MGVGGIGIWQLLIILVIVLLLFGTKKLRNLGGDLGGALKSFKKAVADDKSDKSAEADAAIGDPAEATATDTAASDAVTGADKK